MVPGYRPVALLGSGGMASVWMAARDDGGWCALKVTHPYVAEEEAVQGRFRREADVASQLRHPNIAGVVRAGVVGAQLYLDMELVGGVSLAALMERLQTHGTRVPTGLAWRINDGVLRGLDYAHDRTGADGRPLNIVHRDLTPSNVLVGFDGVVRIIDFGMVRACLGGFQTMLGHIGGTPQYMSPEQARARSVDRRSDLYAWAVVMVELLSGQRLVRPGSLPSVLQAVLRDAAPPLSQLAPSMPEGLDPLFASMLAKDPQQRPPSAGAVRRAADAIVGRSKWSEADVGELIRRVFADRFEIFERFKRHAPTSSADAVQAEACIAGMTAPTVRSKVPMTEPAPLRRSVRRRMRASIR